MSKRERIEDLGRLAIMLSKISSHELFDVFSKGRTKDSWDNFCGLDEDQKEDLILKIAYRLKDVESEICDCLMIAQGNYEED